jgi:hypothetical protein
VFDSEPEAEIDDNVENDQVRLIDRNRVFEHYFLTRYCLFEIMWASGFECGPVSFKQLGAT